MTNPFEMGSALKGIILSLREQFFLSTLLHSEWPKLQRVLAILSAIELRADPY